MLTPTLNPTRQNTDALVIIGRILKPFGVHGEVKVESLSDVPGRFEGLQNVSLTLPHEPATSQETSVTHVRPIPAGYLMKCTAFSTPEEAAHFRGAWIQIPTNPDLPRTPDTFYQFELIGLHVKDPDGQQMGIVTEVLEYPQQHVLVVQNQAVEVLIPASRRAIRKVDLDNQCLYLISKEWWDLTHAL